MPPLAPGQSLTSSPDRILRGSGGRRWRVLGAPNLAGFADAGEGLPALMRVLLAHREVRTTVEARAYLGRAGELTDPQLMPNLDIAVERLARACRAGETVAVFGDYDVDGVTSTTILVEGLRDLGARPIPYLPHRFSEGYGPNVNAVRALAAQGATVLVTADCGTSAVTEVAEANALGMDVLVLDHHTVPEVLPAALAIVNPKLVDSAYGSEPAAVGVSYKVIHDLYDQMGRDYAPASHRALVALGTICDLAPMVSENRDLVRLGLDALRASTRPGLHALCAIAGTRVEEISVETCGWALGPRLNAAGRMEHARLALDLLLATTNDEADALAARLDELNRQRREQTTEAVELARASLTPEDIAGPLLIVASPDISMGIVGLAASRLADEYHRPAIAMQIIDGEGRASCRSIDEFDITALLRRGSVPALRRPPRRGRLQHRREPPRGGARPADRRRRGAPGHHGPRTDDPDRRGAVAERCEPADDPVARAARAARHREPDAHVPRAWRHSRRGSRGGRRGDAPAAHAEGGRSHLAGDLLRERGAHGAARRARGHRVHVQAR